MRMKKICLSLGMILATLATMAQISYEKVSVNPDDWAGTYLIVCESEGVVFNGAANEDAIDAKGGPAIIGNVVIANNVIASTPAIDSAVFTISATDDVDWPWAIQSASGLYIGHKDSVVGDNGLSAETELKNKCKHTLSIVDGNLIATPRHTEGEAYNLQYNKKTDQLRFRYFLPGDKLAVQLYKKSSPSGLKALQSTSRIEKRFENGQIIFIKEGRKYNVLGALIVE